MMFAVGPYQFSSEDARNTLLSAPTILTHMAEGHAEVLGELQGRISQLLNGIDVRRLDESALRRLLPEVWILLEQATPTIRAAGFLPCHAAGIVSQINRSSGGVPKAAVARVEVDFSGVKGDRQATRQHHGRPFQALSLWSHEVIETLRREGHSLESGAAGENITVSGLPWSEVRPGTRLRIGEVLCEVWAYAVPCKQLAHLFVERDFKRIHHERDLETGVSSCRVYATVLECGTICANDSIQCE